MTDCLLDTLLMLCNKWLQVPNGCPYYFLVWIQHYGCYGRPKLNPTCSSKVVSGPLAKRECCWWSANARPALWEGHGPSSASLSCSTAQYALRSKMESINESDGQSSTWGWKSCRIILLIATWICAQGMPQTMDSWRCRKPQEKNHFHKNHPPKSLIFLGKTIGSWDFETPRLAPRPRRARPRDSDCVGRNCGASSAASVIGASKTAKHQPGHGLHMISYDFHMFSQVLTSKIDGFSCGFLDVHSSIEMVFECILSLAHPNPSHLGGKDAVLVPAISRFRLDGPKI